MTDNTSPVPTVFEQLGGEPAIRRLVDLFYDRMEQSPDYAGIRRMHPKDMSETRDKLFWFLCGWFGGPQHFVERFGHPRLRARHLPFSIGVDERDQWLACMREALVDFGLSEPSVAALMSQFSPTADWMRNRSEPGDTAF